MIRTSDKYVNDIIINGDHINRIYLNGDVYWGNDTPPTPQFTGIRGTTNVTSQTLTNALYFNEEYHNINVDENGNFELEINGYVNSTGKLCRSGNITSLDLTHVQWGLTPNKSLTGLFDAGGTYTNLRDVYFDFTGQNTEDMICEGSIFRNVTGGCRIHGFGTFKWTGPLTSNEHWFSLREFCVNNGGLVGTLDIRGIDTTAITDQPNNIASLQNIYGYWYNFPYWAKCDTWIVGSLEIHYLGSFSILGRYCKTLYCTSPTPPSLDRTGTNGVTAKNWIGKLSDLENIYVPTGCLSAYQNASTWSNYANKMSELDAPDPMTI